MVGRRFQASCHVSCVHDLDFWGMGNEGRRLGAGRSHWKERRPQGRTHLTHTPSMSLQKVELPRPPPPPASGGGEN